MKIRKMIVMLLWTGILCFCLPQISSAAQDWLEQGTKAVQELTAPSQAEQSDQLSAETLDQGLKEALKVGTTRVVEQLGQAGGFFNHPELHIPLPESLDTVQNALSKVGASSILDNLELKLNQAAERATPKAKDLFFQAISDMTMQDVRTIYNGPDDAATRYFEDKMSVPLAAEMKPTVQQTLSEVGAVQSLEQIMDKYRSIPLVPDVKTDLTTYTLDKTLDGIFTLLAREEAAIRENPAKRTTELLQTVFDQ